MMNALIPVVSLTPCTLDQANELLIKWEHKMGPLHRGKQSAWCHVLLHEDTPVAVTTARAARDRYYAELCDRIVRLRKAGMSISDIAARVGRARSTVGEILRKRGMQ